jgi:hypothetical protein
MTGRHEDRHQGQQLPVAARPAVQARGRDVRMHGRFLDETHFAQTGAAHQRAFEQVVAEDLVVRQAMAQHLGRSLHMDEPLARERALAEEILVHLGASGAVRVHAGPACEQAVEPGVGFTAGQRRDNARLEDAPALHHALTGRIHLRHVHRVGGHGEQVSQAAGRHVGVAVQRDEVPRACGALRQRAEIQEG